MTVNMTRGKPAGLILRFMLPLLIGNLFQQFYNMADSYIVGHTIGASALAAVGSTGSLDFFILGFAVGTASGFAVLTAQRFGSGDMEGVRRSFAAGIILSGIISFLIMVLSVAFCRPLLELLNTPADIIDDAHRYIQVIFAGSMVVMFYNLFASTLRAVGDSKSPLIFLAIACVINVALDYTFILVFGMGTEGAGLATIIAQAVSAASCWVYLRRRHPELRVGKADFAAARHELGTYLRMGVPMGFQWSIIAIGTICTQFALNQLGTEAIAAFTAATKIENIGSLFLQSFGVTMATYAAQNYGAGLIDRIRVGVRQCCVMSMSLSVVIAVVYSFFGRNLAGIFISDADSTLNIARVLDMAAEYLVFLGLSSFMLGLLFIFRNTLQGLGRTAVPTAAGMMELIMRAAAALILTKYLGFTGACIATPAAWLGASGLLTVAYLLTMKNLQLYGNPNAVPATSE